MSFPARSWALALVSVAALSSSLARAAPVVLADVGQNSQLIIDPVLGESREWYVEGIDNIGLRQWYFRLGAPALLNPELLVDATNLNLAGVNVADFNFIPGNEAMSALYVDPQNRFRLQFSWVLTAGSPGSSQATFVETVRVDNLTAGDLAISLFLYSDFDLAGSNIDGSVVFGEPRAVTQIESLIDPTLSVHEAAVTVTPTHVQAWDYLSLLNSLNDPHSTTLNDNLSAVGGDVAYAFQWDLKIAGNRSFTIGTTNSVTVPELSSVTLVTFAGAIVVCGARLRRGRNG